MLKFHLLKLTWRTDPLMTKAVLEVNISRRILGAYRAKSRYNSEASDDGTASYRAESALGKVCRCCG